MWPQLPAEEAGNVVFTQDSYVPSPELGLPFIRKKGRTDNEGQLAVSVTVTKLRLKPTRPDTLVFSTLPFAPACPHHDEQIAAKCRGTSVESGLEEVEGGGRAPREES